MLSILIVSRRLPAIDLRSLDGHAPQANVSFNNVTKRIIVSCGNMSAHDARELFLQAAGVLTTSDIDGAGGKAIVIDRNTPAEVVHA